MNDANNIDKESEWEEVEVISEYESLLVAKDVATGSWRKLWLQLRSLLSQRKMILCLAKILFKLIKPMQSSRISTWSFAIKGNILRHWKELLKARVLPQNGVANLFIIGSRNG